ncbi:MAG: ATP-binding protein [Agathobacter rectalis]
MNTMKLEFVSRLENEAFARTSAAFLMPLNLIWKRLWKSRRCWQSVVNTMIHGYESRENGTIVLQISYDEEFIHMTVQDEAAALCLQLAMRPLYTVKAYGRSGMGMTIMQTFADDFHIESEKEGNACHDKEKNPSWKRQRAMRLIERIRLGDEEAKSALFNEQALVIRLSDGFPDSDIE